MASAIVCDKCGSIYKTIKDIKHVRIHRLSDVGRFYNDAVKHYDICNNCYEKMFNFKEEK